MMTNSKVSAVISLFESGMGLASYLGYILEESGPEMMGDIIAPLIKSSL